MNYCEAPRAAPLNPDRSGSRNKDCLPVTRFWKAAHDRSLASSCLAIFPRSVSVWNTRPPPPSSNAVLDRFEGMVPAASAFGPFAHGGDHRRELARVLAASASQREIGSFVGLCRSASRCGCRDGRPCRGRCGQSSRRVTLSSPSLNGFAAQDAQLPRCASAANSSTLPPLPSSNASTRLELLVSLFIASASCSAD